MQIVGSEGGKNMPGYLRSGWFATGCCDAFTMLILVKDIVLVFEISD